MSQNGSTMKTTIGSRRWRHLAMIAMARVILGVDDPGVPDHSEPLPSEEGACGGATPSWVDAPCVTGIETGRSVPEGGLFQEVIMFARDVMTPEAEWIARTSRSPRSAASCATSASAACRLVKTIA